MVDREQFISIIQKTLKYESHKRSSSKADAEALFAKLSRQLLSEVSAEPQLAEKVSVHFNKSLLSHGFAVDKAWIMKMLAASPMSANERRSIKILFNEKEYEAKLWRLKDSERYQLRYNIALQNALKEGLPELRAGDEALVLYCLDPTTFVIGVIDETS